MLVNFKEVKVTYQRQGEKGKIEKVNEKYLVNDVTIGKAEEAIYKYVENYGFTEFQVVAVSVANFAEYYGDPNIKDGDQIYKVKMNFITLDEKSGKEKKMPIYYLMNAKSMEEVNTTIKQLMSGSTIDYSIEQITETKYMDVIW